MNWQECFDSFELDNKLAFDQKINPQINLETLSAVMNRDRYLTFESNPSPLELRG